MSIHITNTQAGTGKKNEYFYKRVGPNIAYSIMGYAISATRISVDIRSKRDIKRIKEFLDNIECNFE